MSKDGSPTGTKRKKCYAKPSISEVKLRPEEAVLGNCKIAEQSGPGTSGCVSGVPCTTLAS